MDLGLVLRRPIESTALIGKVKTARFSMSAYPTTQEFEAWTRRLFWKASYCLRATGGPLTRFPVRSTVTSMRSAIVTKGMPLFIP